MTTDLDNAATWIQIMTAIGIAACACFVGAAIGILLWYLTHRKRRTPNITVTVAADTSQFERELTRVYQALGHLPNPPDPIKLTREQFDAMRGVGQGPAGRKHGGPVGGLIGDLAGTRVQIVDTVEESTPHQIRRGQQP